MIIIVSQNKIKIENTFLVNSLVTIIDDYHLLYNNEIIEFDYLITDDYHLLKDLQKANILLDEDLPVTNFFGQTSVEHIYVGDILTAIDHIYNGE